MNNFLPDMLVEISKSLETMQLPDPCLLRYYQDEADRILWLEGEVREDLFEISKHIMHYNRVDKDIPVEDRKPIKIFINSPGGLLEETLAFVKLVEMSKTPVWTINMAGAHSAAGLILMSGHRRFSMPNTSCVIHSGSGTVGGTYEQTAEQMKNYDKLIEKSRDFILSKTKIDKKRFNKNKTKEWYVYTDEMLEYGIVDEIVTDLDILF